APSSSRLGTMTKDVATIRTRMAGFVSGIIACQIANAIARASVAEKPAASPTRRQARTATSTEIVNAQTSSRPSGPIRSSANSHPFRILADVVRIFWQEPTVFCQLREPRVYEFLVAIAVFVELRQRGGRQRHLRAGELTQAILP